MWPPFGVVEEIVDGTQGHYFAETGEVYSSYQSFPGFFITREINKEKAIQFVGSLYDAIEAGKATKYIWSFAVACEHGNHVRIQIEIAPRKRPVLTLHGCGFDDRFEASLNLITAILNILQRPKLALFFWGGGKTGKHTRGGGGRCFA